MPAENHQQRQMAATHEQPSAALLKAWQFLKGKEYFITPAQIAQAAQVGHDVAETYLQNWLEQGILERAPRYPRYVYHRAQNWHSRAIAQQLNRRT